MLAIKYLPIDDLVPYSGNARTHSEDQIKEIVKSIKKHGWTNPILLDGNKGIIAGHGRLLAARKLNLNEVPTIDLSFASDAQKAEYIIADNKLALNAGWDFDLLRVEFDILEDAGIDITDTGFSEDELNAIRNPEVLNEGLCDDEDVPGVDSEHITRLGDVWCLGKSRLMCGDSTVIDSVEKLMNGENPIIMVTDPPYGVEYDPLWREECNLGAGKKSRSKVENDDVVNWNEAYCLFNGDIAYVWHAGKYTHIIAKNLIDCDFDLISQIIWAKNNFAISRGDYHWKHEPCWYAVRKGKNHNWMGKRDQSTLWEINNTHQKDENEKVGHGTQKPVECMARPIINNTRPNDFVYDPFGGSGTTLIASEKLGRSCLMMELSPYYCDVIIKRWQKFTGKQAILESTQQTFDEVANG